MVPIGQRQGQTPPLLSSSVQALPLFSAIIAVQYGKMKQFEQNFLSLSFFSLCTAIAEVVRRLRGSPEELNREIRQICEKQQPEFPHFRVFGVFRGSVLL